MTQRRQLAMNKIIEGFSLIENGMLIMISEIEDGEALHKLVKEMKGLLKEEVERKVKNG